MLLVLIFRRIFAPIVSDKVTLLLPIEESEGWFEATAIVVRVEEASENTFGIAVKF